MAGSKLNHGKRQVILATVRQNTFFLVPLLRGVIDQCGLKTKYAAFPSLSSHEMALYIQHKIRISKENLSYLRCTESKLVVL